MNRLGLVVVAPFLAGALFAACGGVSGDSLFGVGGGATFTTTASSGAAPSSSHASSSGVTTASSSGQVSSAASSSSSGSMASSTSSSSSSSTASSSSSTSASSSSGVPLPPVYCNGAPCQAGEICCFNPTGPGDHCGKAGQCGQGYSELSCSSPADCSGGQVCCATFMATPTSRIYQSVACSSSCNDAATQVVICSADPGVCPPGTTCVQSTLLGTGYQICNH